MLSQRPDALSSRAGQRQGTTAYLAALLGDLTLDHHSLHARTHAGAGGEAGDRSAPGLQRRSVGKLTARRSSWYDFSSISTRSRTLFIDSGSTDMDALAFMVSARAARRRASVGCVGLWGKVGVALRPQPPPGKRLALACDVIARKAAAQAQRGLGSAADRTGRRPKLGAVGPATHRGTANAAPLPRTVKTQSPSSPWPRTRRSCSGRWLQDAASFLQGK